MAFGMNWPEYLVDLSNQNIPDCYVISVNLNYFLQSSQTYADFESEGIDECGNPGNSYPFILSYIVFIGNIIIYLYLAVVIGGYVKTKKEDGAIISPSEVDDFFTKWAEYDKQGTGFITPDQFAFLINDLPPPLGLKDDTNPKFQFG